MKLAKAAAQQLKAVVVEYDVLCSTLLGKSAAEQAEQQRRKVAMAADQQRESTLFSASSVQSLLVSDVRELLKRLDKDATGKPWAVKERLQNTLKGLPSEFLERAMGSRDMDVAAGGTHSGDTLVNEQLQLALDDVARQKNVEKGGIRDGDERTRRSNSWGIKTDCETSSVRDKYLDKISRLKQKTRTSRGQKDGPRVTATGRVDGVETITSAGLSTWIVNPGANEVLSYSDLRGLLKVVIPARDPLQHDEYKFFLKEMEGQFDMFLSKEDQAKFPDPEPLLHVCTKFDLEPSDVLVLTRHAATIKAAKSAGTHVCHYMPEAKAIANHTAHYHLTRLSDYQHLIEGFNGVSYRDKITVGSIEF
ncbi:unnamed protein product [Hyaloperonospora brassicae]|uniref:Uncharacterized protein n=1 Tax=Hyaloperonospora brassicae TaxID=162125 RepID=A0AAV0TIQ6_HYABA|nr:unnamed protein product [Hyaloperonospora brassicae]